MNAARMLLCLVVALGVILAVPASTRAAATANVPTWTVGQAVGYGTNMDLTSLAAPYLQSLRENITAGATLNELNFTGSLDTWVHDQVTGKSSTEYTLSSRDASGVKVHFVLNATIPNSPNPGTYNGVYNTTYHFCQFPTNIPTSPRTIAYKVDVSLLQNGTSMSLYEVSNLGVTKQVVNTTLRASGTFSAYNLPSTTFNFSDPTCPYVVSYQSRSLTVTVNSQDQLRSTYAPGLDMFHFPISDGNVWTTQSNATVGATLSGTVNVKGLSSQEEQGFFQNLTRALNSTGNVQISGLSGFPIDLAKISITVSGVDHVIQNGVVQDQTAPVAESLRATASVKTLSDNQQHDVYLIGLSAYQCPTTTGLPYGYQAVYAPDFPAANAGMVVGYVGLYCNNGVSTTAVSLDNVPASQADSNIQQTITTYNPFPAGGNPFVDFFLAPPFYGIILIVAVAAVVAFLFVRSRRKRAAMMQAQQPQTPPPPPPQP